MQQLCWQLRIFVMPAGIPLMKHKSYQTYLYEVEYVHVHINLKPQRSCQQSPSSFDHILMQLNQIWSQVMAHETWDIHQIMIQNMNTK